MKEALKARYAAFQVLERVLRQGKTLELALTDVMAKCVELSEADRAFAHALIMTVLRRQGQLNHLIRLVMPKALPARRAAVQTILCMGTAGLFFMKLPAHACVDTAVELAKAVRLSPFARLINGVLRTLARQPELLAQTDAERDNLPDWLWQRWCRIYGEEKTRAFVAASLTEPMLDMTVKENPDLWAKRWGGTVLAGGTVRIAPGAVQSLQGYQEGAWWVQEASAALPAQLLPIRPGMRVADLCAAPGGKTAQLAVRGARVDAFDVSSRRLSRLWENMARLGLAARVDVHEGDALDFAPAKPYEAILLDAPCSATGTLQRHPDVKVHRTMADVQRLADMQYRMLERAILGLQKGGVVVFSTCSLEPEEGEDLIARFLTAHPTVQRLPIREESFASWTTPEGDLRCVPTDGRDGFFAARLTRAE